MTAPLFLLALTLAHGDPDTTVRLPRGGAIEIEATNSNIVVNIGNTDVVTILGGTAELDGHTLQISGDEDGHRTLEVTLPAWARVDASTLNGNLTFRGAPDRLHAETVGGFIHLTGGGGTIDLESVAGAVVITDFRGTSLSVDATNGPVTVTNATGKISIENVNGSISLRGIRSDDLSASTINGAIMFEGPLAASGRYELSSQNSDVTLELPGDVSARMKISTMNGQLISPQIPATVGGARNVTPPPAVTRGKAQHQDRGDDEDGERTFTAVYGTGSAQVTIEVFNGNVVVRKKP